MAEEKKQPKKAPAKGRWNLYQKTEKNKFCPKCGAGTFLAEHKDRMTCGKCGYMETKKK